MSSFYWKKSSFFGKNGTFIQSNTARAVLEIFYFCFTINKNFTDYAFGIRLPDFSKLFTDRKDDNDVTNYRHEFIAKLFVVVVFLWSKFHVNIITGSEVMTILFYKELIRNLEIGNNSVCFLPNIWRLGQVKDTKFAKNVSNEMLMNSAKGQSYIFYWFLVNKGKTNKAGGGGGARTGGGTRE